MALTALAVVGAGPAAAWASSFAVGSQRVLSGPSPFAACAASSGDVNYVLEPSLASDPRSPRRLVAAWQQDAGRDGARGIVAGWSSDAGRHWQRAGVPGVARCSGGAFGQVTDAWVSVGADGVDYLASVAFDPAGPGSGGAVQISRSRDHGRHWSNPTIVARGTPTAGLDKGVVTGDPRRRGRAYLTWDDSISQGIPAGGALYFSRTTNGGRSWSRRRAIYRPSNLTIVISSQTLVLPDGTLVVVFSQESAVNAPGMPPAQRTGRWKLLAVRSRDGGRTWSRATVVARIPITVATDPVTGRVIFAPPEIFSATADPRGDVFVAWHEVSSSRGAIRYVRATHHATRWSRSKTLARLPAPAFSPTIASLPNGTLGLTWYDLSRDHPGDSTTTADWWFAHSDNHGRRWRQQHLAGPFDLATAHPSTSRGQRLGEYFGLTLTAGGLNAVYITSQPGPNPTTVQAARLTQRR